jgi:hypothetical protein
MKAWIVVAVGAAFASGCAGFEEKVAASRQDRCERADWKHVGERDGFAGNAAQAERYEYICGELFQAAPYKEGLRDGLARRRPAPV